MTRPSTEKKIQETTARARLYRMSGSRRFQGFVGDASVRMVTAGAWKHRRTLLMHIKRCAIRM